jgi:DNA-binding CsgD family transcriptional regulator
VTGSLSWTPPRRGVRIGAKPGRRTAAIDGAARPMARRFDRLCKRLQSTEKPIVWLRAMPGSGKTRLFAELRRRAAALRVAEWLLLDDPSSDALQVGLAARGILSEPSQQRLLIASRSSSEVAQSLLTPRLYGFVDVIDERELFLRPADCRPTEGAAILAATGGWPLLVDGYLSGRSVEMMQMLPAFLDREVLPDLPPPVTTALFGALPAPLGAAAVDYLFGTQQELHPLLQTAAAGVTVAGEWVRDALLKLRTQPQALKRSVLDDLIRLHTQFAEPARAITSLVDLGLFTQAIEVYNAAGGMFFGYRHGYQALETVLEKFGPDWERRTESLFFARLYLMIKSGQPREALLRLEAQYAGLPIDLRRLRLSHRPYAVLMRIDMSLDNETPPLEVISSWGRLGALFAPGDEMARGILYNTMAIGFLQAGALVQAQELAQEALTVYERAGSPYLAHFMLLHLCDLSLRHGRLRDAADEVRRADEALRTSGLAFNSEPAIIECFKARIAYEEGRFADCPAAIEPILEALLRGDSWPGLISAMAGHFVFTAFWQQGLRKALDRLDHCALTLSRRHGPTENRSMELIRIRLFQVARRHEEAGARLEEYDLETPGRRVPQLDTEEGLIRLRHQIVQQSSVEAALKFAAELANLPSLEARHRITLTILQAYLRHRRAEHGLARRHLSVALRNAEAHNLLGVLVEDGEFLERLLPLFIATPGPGNARLVAFAQRVARLLRTLPSAPMYSKALAGVTRREHGVLSYVADGYTNKQIARALGCSESAVKFHLRNLFRKLKVSSRTALCDAVERRGIRT